MSEDRRAHNGLLKRTPWIAVLLLLPLASSGCISHGAGQGYDIYRDTEIVTEPMGPFTAVEGLLEEPRVLMQTIDSRTLMIPEHTELSHNRMAVLEDGELSMEPISRKWEDYEFRASVAAWGEGKGLFIGWKGFTSHETEPTLGVYDLDSNEWDFQPLVGNFILPMIRGNCTLGHSFVADQAMILAGCNSGESGRWYGSKIYRVDESTGIIHEIGQFREFVDRATFAMHEGVLYAMGSGESSLAIQRFELATGHSETTSASLPWSSKGMTAASNGDHIYLFGSRQDGDIIRYDPQTHEVHVMEGRIPGIRLDPYVGWNGEAFVLAGGQGPGREWNDVLLYDPGKDSVATEQGDSGLDGAVVPGRVLASSPGMEGYVLSDASAFGRNLAIYDIQGDIVRFVADVPSLDEYNLVKTMDWVDAGDIPECPKGCPLALVETYEFHSDFVILDASACEVQQVINACEWQTVSESVSPASNYNPPSIDIDGDHLLYYDGNTTITIINLATSKTSGTGTIERPYERNVAVWMDEDALMFGPYALNEGPYSPFVHRFVNGAPATPYSETWPPITLWYRGLEIIEAEQVGGSIALLSESGPTCNDCPTMYLYDLESDSWRVIWTASNDFDLGWNPVIIADEQRGQVGVFGYTDGDDKNSTLLTIDLPTTRTLPVIEVDQDEGEVTLHAAGVSPANAIPAWSVHEVKYGFYSDPEPGISFKQWDCCSEWFNAVGTQITLPSQEGRIPLEWWSGYQVRLYYSTGPGDVSVVQKYLMPDGEGGYTVSSTYDRSWMNIRKD